MLNNLAYLRYKRFPQVLVSTLWVLYLIAFVVLYARIGLGSTPLAVIPVVGAGWYFGALAGIMTGGITLLADLVILILMGRSPLDMLNAGGIVGNFAVFLVGWIVGRLGEVTRQNRIDLKELQQLEGEQRGHSIFLSILNEITQAALGTNDLETFLEILVRRMDELFAANDCLFALWDEVNQMPVPKIAYGPARETYPSIRLEPNETNLAIWILDSRKPLAIADYQNSPYRTMMSPEIVTLLARAKSLLGLPLVSQSRKLGLMYLSFHESRDFSGQDIEQAELAAHHIALILTRVQMFEESQRRIKELAVLHEIALASTQVEGEDQLLDRATEIIGQSLFPDNFGILLLDETARLLRPHHSYRVYSPDYDAHAIILQPGLGVSGQVAQSGKAQRIGDVRQVPDYLNVDVRTRSELCVPLKFKERILGVVNAESTELNAFTLEDERLMITLAGQLATALEYLRSLEAERHWMNQLAHSNELASALSHVTTEIEKAFSAGEVIGTLEDELQKMGLSCVPAFYFRDTDQMIFRYASILPAELRRPKRWSNNNHMTYELVAEKMEVLFGIENILAPMILPDPLETMQVILSGLPKKAITQTLSIIGVAPDTEIIHLPLIFEDRLLGTLWLWGNDLTRTDLPVMSIFAKQIAIALENARLFQEVQNLALTDPLTGLYNRRGLFELGRIEFARSLRAGRSFSGIMLDLDHFKKINDTYGHSIGDRVLQEVAKRCKKSVREVDFVGRYGGEEIIILLPETDLETSTMVAERLRKTISDVPIRVADRLALNITASFGVARQDENTPNLETLIARADQAMYIAKHKGRNRVSVST